MPLAFPPRNRYNVSLSRSAAIGESSAPRVSLRPSVVLCVWQPPQGHGRHFQGLAHVPTAPAIPAPSRCEVCTRAMQCVVFVTVDIDSFTEECYMEVFGVIGFFFGFLGFVFGVQSRDRISGLVKRIEKLEGGPAE